MHLLAPARSALALIGISHFALTGSLALTGSSWLWLLLIGSGPCVSLSRGAGILLSQFTVSTSGDHVIVSQNRGVLVITRWHNLTYHCRINSSCSGGWRSFTIIQLQAAFQHCCREGVCISHLSVGGSSSGSLRLGLALYSGGLAGWAQTLCSVAVFADAYAQANRLRSGSDRVFSCLLTGFLVYWYQGSIRWRRHMTV